MKHASGNKWLVPLHHGIAIVPILAAMALAVYTYQGHVARASAAEVVVADKAPVVAEEISDEKFACNCETIRVCGKDADVSIKKGESSGFIPIDGRTIAWFCCGRPEDWQAPEATSKIRVFRSSRGAGRVIYYR